VSSWVDIRQQVGGRRRRGRDPEHEAAGRVTGTADDDVLEDDGVWTVTKYTAQDLADGLIRRKSSATSSPEAGRTSTATANGTAPLGWQFNLNVTLDSSNWAKQHASQRRASRACRPSP
jgi:hypothetical protein